MRHAGAPSPIQDPSRTALKSSATTEAGEERVHGSVDPLRRGGRPAAGRRRSRRSSSGCWSALHGVGGLRRRIEGMALEARGRLGAVLDQHRIHFGLDRRHCIRLTHDLHDVAGLGDERVDRKHRQHGLQGAWHVDAGQLDQAAPARARIVGVHQHEAIAMAHRGQRVQQVGAKHGAQPLELRDARRQTAMSSLCGRGLVIKR
jgi:hypothetical protein